MKLMRKFLIEENHRIFSFICSPEPSSSDFSFFMLSSLSNHNNNNKIMFINHENILIMFVFNLRNGIIIKNTKKREEIFHYFLFGFDFAAGEYRLPFIELNEDVEHSSTAREIMM